MFTVLHVNVLYHAFLFITNTIYFFFKKSCFKYFPLLSFTDIEIKLDVNEIMELPVCVQKKIDFFCTKITFLHFWYIFNYLYSTTVLHFMCSVYADQFSSVLLNDKSTNIVLLHKSFILFASIQSINIVYFNLEAFCCFFLLFLFDWLVLPQWISFQSITFFLLILSSPPYPSVGIWQVFIFNIYTNSSIPSHTMPINE